jgi:hypothetical protein
MKMKEIKSKKELKSLIQDKGVTVFDRMVKERNDRVKHYTDKENPETIGTAGLLAFTLDESRIMAEQTIYEVLSEILELKD